ncbi:MAG TPA: serine/threonine-protein kinase [Vicinamibacterales bacterium]|jgi:serine/threonine protein kinase|nr:serine/threonine-protein kinase [Vicinamibacterales bacterium]
MTDAIAHYKVLAPLGVGGLGEVFRARDTRLGRTVAVKVLPAAIASDPARLRPLLDAATVASSMSHPNITTLFEVGEDGGQTYLVFEFVPGDPLTALIDGRALNVRRAVELAIQLADALADAEAHDLVHGDIRPGTIVVTSKDRAKFMNFGLAAFTAGGARRREASRVYVAPEEIKGPSGEIRSDIFSLGAVLFEMLTGRPRGQGLAPSSLNKAVPPELDRIVGRMLAGNADQRFQSAATVAAELRAMAAILEARATADEAAFEPPRRASRRSGAVVAIGALLLFAAVVAWLWRSLASR